MTAEIAPQKQMRLRYAGTCRLCGLELAARTLAVYERASQTVRCVDCSEDTTAEPPVVDPGTPGASARREYLRRRAKDEQAIRDRHPRTARLRLALGSERRSTKSWATGATGEEQLGAALERKASDRLRVLHDRRIPGSRANIDHIVVTPAGVWVIDPKRYVDQRPVLRVEGGVVRPRTERLFVGGRNRTPLVEGVEKQLGVLREVVGSDVPLRGVLCFIEASWPVFGGDFRIREIDVVWPRRLHAILDEEGPLVESRIEQLYQQLGLALPPA